MGYRHTGGRDRSHGARAHHDVFYLVLLDPWVGDRLWLAAYPPVDLALLALLRTRAGSAGRTPIARTTSQPSWRSPSCV